MNSAGAFRAPRRSSNRLIHDIPLQARRQREGWHNRGVDAETRFRISGIPLALSGGPDSGSDGARILDLDFGPTHPAGAGLLTGRLTTRDGVVTGIDPEPGALHRGAELLFPARDYRQALSLANRHDWQAPFFGEWAVASVVEAELGVEVPPRAQWIRCLLAEHTRMLSHLGHLTFVGWRLAEPALSTDAVREALRRQTAALTGNRVHPMVCRLGGVAADVEQGWAADESRVLSDGVGVAHRLLEALDRTGLGRGLAPVAARTVDAYGLAGPVARASGVATDLRRSATPAPLAGMLDLLDTPAPMTGDAHARFCHLAWEVVSSARLVSALLGGLPDGPLRAHLPKVVKLPETDAHGAVEAPLGRAGVFIVSRGEKTPWRLHLRTPSAANVSAWAAVVPGTPLPGLDVALASLPWVAGDLDK